MVNINDLKIGINQILDAEFPSITIYGEEIKQGFKEPCFFIKILNSGQDKKLNRRYKKNISFDVHYFTEKEDINADYNDMADKLYELLEYVAAGDNLYRPNSMTHEVVDEVLHFFLQFNFYVLKQIEAAPKMNKLIKEVGLKNG